MDRTPLTATTLTGAPGARAGATAVTTALWAEAVPVPAALIAATVKL
jgi:hypothetical protein